MIDGLIWAFPPREFKNSKADAVSEISAVMSTVLETIAIGTLETNPTIAATIAAKHELTMVSVTLARITFESFLGLRLMDPAPRPYTGACMRTGGRGAGVARKVICVVEF